MTSKKSILKIIMCCVLVLTLLLPYGIKFIFAEEETLTIATLISDHTDQEITNTINNFSTDFGDKNENPSLNGWTTPVYERINFVVDNDENGNIIRAVDLTSDEEFEYASQEISYSSIGTDGIAGNKYGLLFVTKTAGVAGVESAEITIPAHAIYVLTFNVKIGEIPSSNSTGLNAKIIDVEKDKTISMAAIKTKSSNYKTYSFLIRGNEFSSRTVKLQLLWGNVTESDGEYTGKTEVGYAVVDTIRLFSVTGAQYVDLATVSANTKVDLFTSNSNAFYIPNGYFSFTDNQQWDLTKTQSISDLRPSDWVQETAITEEESRVAHFGLIDIYSTNFNNRMEELDLNLVNPGSPTGISEHNNVLLLYNEENTYQTITSKDISLTKSKYYEISFKFNTPVTSETENGDKNSLNFYVVDTNGTMLYSREDMFSYLEWAEDINEWATFRLFIKTSTEDKKVKFVIKFGTEEETKSGYAYIDEVILSTKSNASTVFTNNLADTFILKTEEGQEIKYLATGGLSFSDLENLDSTNKVNYSLATFDYTTPPLVDDNNTNNDNGNTTTTSPTSSQIGTYLWYVIPSVLLGLCIIFGLVIFYARKVKSKIKLPKKYKKGNYDRKKTLEKQVARREKENSYNKEGLEKQLKAVRSQIEKLEESYHKVKSNKLALKDYVHKREKLQIKENKLLNSMKENK